MVTTFVDNAAAIWAAKRYACYETVQHRAIQTFLGTWEKSSLPAIDGDMGWKPVQIRHQKEIILYFMRLYKLPDGKLKKVVFS